MSIEEAAELARRSIYHATFRDGASGGVASGLFLISHVIIIKDDDLVQCHHFYSFPLFFYLLFFFNCFCKLL